MSKTHCDVCNRLRSWGCGHSREQEKEARLHEKTKEHLTGACWHFDHSECKRSQCSLAQTTIDGYAPFVKHRDAESFFANIKKKESKQKGG